MDTPVRTLVHVVPSPATRGEIVEVRVTLGHPMETGHRADSNGRVVPRDIVTRFECWLDGERVFGMDLFPAVAANPYVAFPLRVHKSGTLELRWEGDHGFRHAQALPLQVT